MNIKIPSNKSITIRDFIAWSKCKTDIERMYHITGMPEKKVLQFKPETIDKIIEMYQDSIDDTSGEFVRSFRIRKNWKSKRLAIIPNFESMSVAEYIDTDEFLKQIQKKQFDAIPKLLAVLYRPIDLKLGDWYRLEPYDTDKVPYYIEHLKDISLYQYNGLLAFFLDFAVELLEDLHQSSQVMTEKIMNQQEIPDSPHSDGSTS